MALQEIEKLHTSIVVLPVGDFDLNISAGELSKVVREPRVELLPPPASIATISSLRDQVEIIIGRGRIQIRDDSDFKPGAERFTRIVADFTNLISQVTGVGYRAFGWNFDISFKLGLDEQPAKIIATRFINQNAIRSATNLEVIGGAIRFFYEKESALCYLYIEPRGNKLDAQQFYSHINVHYSEMGDSLPGQDELESSFRREYQDYINLLEKLLA